MVYTKIEKLAIQSKENEDLLIVFFYYEGKLHFTKLTKVSREYWKKKAKINKFYVGQDINVFKTPKTCFYKIIWVSNKTKDEINE
jgi:hypothetical protein